MISPMYERIWYVYIMASKPGGTLYTGVSNNVLVRAWQHKNKVNNGFTKTYHVNLLVYYESFGSPLEAIRREKQIKHYNRNWKIRLIKSINPTWKDLGRTEEESMGPPPSRRMTEGAEEDDGKQKG